MRTLAIALASTALFVSACNRNEDAASENAIVDAGNEATTNLNAAATMPTTAQAFVDAAAASDRFEIESSKLAQTSSQSSEIKKFASQMVTGHTKTTEKLKATVASLSLSEVTLNDALNAEQQALLDGLKGKTGAEFDSAYKLAQITAHQKTLDMLKAYVATGDTPALVDLAKETIPVVTAHINLANSLK